MTRIRRVVSCVLAALAIGSATLQAQIAIPTTYALASSAADTNQPGFVFRFSEVNAAQPNTLAFTENQLAGLEGDNLADPTVTGPALAAATPPNPSTGLITFLIPTVINMSKVDGTSFGAFVPDDQMPGLPGGGPNGTDNAAAEILTYLNLPAGTITMGVNSDDGFRMSLGGSTPADKLNAVNVGQYEGGRGAGDTIFTFSISKAGIYAARLIWENGGGDANIEWFTVNNGTNKVLVNDKANGGIAAYRAVTGGSKGVARTVSPGPGAVAVPPNAPIHVELVDGTSPIDPKSIALRFDGAAAAATVTKLTNVNTINFTNTALFPAGSQHTVVLTYTDGTAFITNTWTFTAANYATLTPNYKVTADTAKPGFIWNIFDNSGDTQNSNQKTEDALNGMLRDSTGVLLPNLADPNAKGEALAAAAAASPANGVLHFEIATVINLARVAGTAFGTFTNDLQMPGMPPTDGNTDGTAAEILTYLDLPAGVITMGVNSDDGFRTLSGDAQDAFGSLLLGEFDGGRGASDTTFIFVVQQAGVYPFRTTWENGGGDADIEWFSVKPDGKKVLINDVANGGIKAYRAVTSPVKPYVKYVNPPAVPRQVNQPQSALTLIVADGTTAVDDNSIALAVYGNPASVTKTRQGKTVLVTYAPNTLLIPSEQYAMQLSFKDSTGANSRVQQWTQLNLKNVVLPAAVITETFDEYPEGTTFLGPQTKTNWYAFNFTDPDAAGEDITSVHSDTYKGWVVVTADTMTGFEGDSANIRPGETLNGQPITALISGNVLFAESDNRSGSQAQFVISKAFNLSSVTNPVLSFSSIYKQNQDSVGTAEYSVDGGTSWLPIVYYLDGAAPSDIVLNPDGSVNAVATFKNPNLDTATWKDTNGVAKGGNYGDALAAPITQALGLYVAPRLNDDKFEGKRMEVFRLPQASKKADVRLRFAQLGTCSWYYAIDNIAFYDVAPLGVASAPAHFTSVTSSGLSITLNWEGGVGPFLVQRKSSLSDTNWTSMLTTTNHSAIVANQGATGFFRIVEQASSTVVAFSAWMSGAAEQPTAVTSNGTGFGIFSLEGNKFNYDITYSGLSSSAVASHIHGAATSTNSAGVIIPFPAPSGTSGRIVGSATVSDTIRSNILAGQTYANIHTVNFSGGEIRGQLVPSNLQANMTGAAEKPTAVTSSGTATASFTIIGNELTYNIPFSNLTSSAVAAHIHGPATADQSAGVIIPFPAPSGTSGVISGKATLSLQNLGFIVDGLTYANIHTVNFSGGELRGQIGPAQ